MFYQKNSVVILALEFYDTVFERVKVQNSKSSNTDLEPETTGLSAYLNFGALSVRTLWYAAVSVDDEQTAVTVHGQLLYREFFYCVAFTVSPQKFYDA